MDESKKKMILDWMRKIHTLEYAHRFESVDWQRTNYWLGVPALIIAAIVAALASMCEIKDEIYTKMLLAVGSICVAILTGLQTFLKPSELAQKHRAASATYENLRHKIEYLLQFRPNAYNLDAELEKIRTEWMQIDSLNSSMKNFNKAKTKVKEFAKYPDELSFL
jgi:hypothetical protein